MSAKRSPNDTELALLSAFLDGELSPTDEADLLTTLAQRPDLQDALDDLAFAIASTQRAFSPDGDDVGSLISARVMAELDPDAVAADVAAAETLASLAVDGASTAAQDRRLGALLQDAALADAAASFVAAADVARAAVSVDAEASVARALATLPEHVLARVERTERGWALCTGAIDGQLSPAEVNELAGLCGADDDLYAALTFEVQHGLFAGEALRAAALSPVFLQHAERAGAAALQAIAAVQAQEQQARQQALAKATTTTTTVAPTLFDRVRTLFGQGFAPLFAATAALLVFVVIGKSEPPTTTHPDASAFAALQKAFVDAAAPVVLADNHSVPTTELAVLADNSADVEAIDATGTTMVFSTAESNITVIWVAGLDEEQGT
jgi:hypothetical protein